MGGSSSKEPRYDLVEAPTQVSSSSDSPNPQGGSFSPPTQGLLDPHPQNSQWAPVQQAPPPPLPAGWDFAIDPATGYSYFYHTQSQLTQWDDPRGPGYGLPERNAASSSTSGNPQRILPPWEGGPVDGVDPLSWPLPPGWQEQIDLATNQHYFVNYDARIMSFNDPRVEIAEAYGRNSVVHGFPVTYPAPAFGRVVDRPQHEFRPPSGFGTAGAQSPGYQPIHQAFPPPPSAGKRKKQSLWSQLGYRHGFGKVRPYRPLQLGLLSVPHGSFGRSSSSSSDSSDDEGHGDEAAAVVADPLIAGGDSSGSDGGDGDGNDDQSSGHFGDGDGQSGGGWSSGFGLGGGDSAAVDEYGNSSSASPDSSDGEGQEDEAADVLAGPDSGGSDRGFGGFVEGGRFASDGGGGLSAGSSFTWQRQAKRSHHKSLPCSSRTLVEKFYRNHGYSKLSFLMTVVVGLYFGALEGFLSLALVSTGILMVSLRKSYPLVRVKRKTLCRIRNIIRSALGKGSVVRSATSSLSKSLVQLQAWFYEYIYEHRVVKVRVLTARDEAGPLYSRLPLRPRDITIVTQASADRLPAVEAMAKSWGGTMCVAFYVTSKSELKKLYPKLRNLHSKVEAQKQCRLNACVVSEEGPLADTEARPPLYPINAMRNVALNMAVTDLVLILDADFVPSKRMHDTLAGDESFYNQLLRMAVQERQMLVVPAFEASIGRYDDLQTSKATYPTTYQELKEKWTEGVAMAFHCFHFPRGHMPTNYERFFSSTSEPYKVKYREYYEPYTVCARTLVPQFDPRFRGYGMNKISHAYHCASMGMGFTVLPEVFVWSLPHRKSQAWAYTFGVNKDPIQKLKILGLYRRFKREVHRGRARETEVDRPKTDLIEIKVEQPSEYLHLANPGHCAVQTVS
ncbi:hypothetical protein R1sor_003650 [Riccia sorocarpa]|uniref:WW domain-containing protein n=1 Tax=Riccia sorocarpa TaxID=122646 RepID=A0ABD3H314_9MARC